ncbi:MAG: hypothetical protein IKP40_10305 [Clostridia bacterium]|nr:hypothetical protein [Clostridia bacterium]
MDWWKFDPQGMVNRLWNVGTLLMALGAVLCFASAPVSSFLERRLGPAPKAVQNLGWDNAVKMLGLAAAVIGAFIVLFR